MAGADRARRPGRAGRGGRADRGLGVRAAAPDPDLAALAGLDGARAGRARRAGAAAAQPAATGWPSASPTVPRCSAGLAGPAAYALATAATPHTGAIPSAGPAVAGCAAVRAGAPAGPPGSFRPPDGGPGAAFGTGRAGSAGGGAAGGNAPGGDAAGGTGAAAGVAGPAAAGRVRRRRFGAACSAAPPRRRRRRRAASATRRLHLGGRRRRLQQRRRLPAGHRAAGDAVGGFNGSDPSPTLAQFQQLRGRRPDPLVHRRRQGCNMLGDPSSGGSDQARQIAEWVRRHLHPGHRRTAPCSTTCRRRAPRDDDRIANRDDRGDATGRRRHTRSAHGGDSARRDRGRHERATPRRPPPGSHRGEPPCWTWWSRSTTRRPTSSRRCGGCTRHLTEQFPYPFRITIADNASTDATPVIAARLAAELPDVAALRLAEKGRGRALRAAWSASDAQVLAYMDVDLSTDLAALLPLVAPLISGHSDLAIGTRLGPALPGGARGQAGVHLARLQPAAARHAGRPVLRRPVRLQGDPRRRGRGGCCRWSRTPAGSSTPSCWCWPSGPGCASTRCRWTGSTTRTAASTSSPPRWPT